MGSAGAVPSRRTDGEATPGSAEEGGAVFPRPRGRRREAEAPIADSREEEELGPLFDLPSCRLSPFQLTRAMEDELLGIEARIRPEQHRCSLDELLHFD